MTKILKIDYVNGFPEDDQDSPTPIITMELEDKSIAELHTPNVNRIGSLIGGGFLKARKTIDVPIRTLPEGRMFIDEEFEIKKAEKISKKSNKKAKETFGKIGIDYVDKLSMGELVYINSYDKYIVTIVQTQKVGGC